MSDISVDTSSEKLKSRTIILISDIWRCLKVYSLVHFEEFVEMEMLERYIVSARVREIIYVKANRFAAAYKCGSRSFFLSGSTFIEYVRYRRIRVFRQVYVGELESSNPRARYDLPFPHFIDPTCYTNKLVAPPRPLTLKESYPDVTGRDSSLFPFVGFGNRWHSSARVVHSRRVFSRGKVRAGMR